MLSEVQKLLTVSATRTSRRVISAIHWLITHQHRIDRCTTDTFYESVDQHCCPSSMTLWNHVSELGFSPCKSRVDFFKTSSERAVSGLNCPKYYVVFVSLRLSCSFTKNSSFNVNNDPWNHHIWMNPSFRPLSGSLFHHSCWWNGAILSPWHLLFFFSSCHVRSRLGRSSKRLVVDQLFSHCKRTGEKQKQGVQIQPNKKQTGRHLET